MLLENNGLTVRDAVELGDRLKFFDAEKQKNDEAEECWKADLKR